MRNLLQSEKKQFILPFKPSHCWHILSLLHSRHSYKENSFHNCRNYEGRGMEGSKDVQPQVCSDMGITRGQWVLLLGDTVHPQAVILREEGRAILDQAEFLGWSSLPLCAGNKATSPCCPCFLLLVRGSGWHPAFSSLGWKQNQLLVLTHQHMLLNVLCVLLQLEPLLEHRNVKPTKIPLAESRAVSKVKNHTHNLWRIGVWHCSLSLCLQLKIIFLQTPAAEESLKTF